MEQDINYQGKFSTLEVDSPVVINVNSVVIDNHFKSQEKGEECEPWQVPGKG